MTLLESNSDDFTIEEEDIPGAKLQEPAEQCTVAVLKRWLSCHGAKVTGKREDLVKRFVQLYMFVVLFIILYLYGRKALFKSNNLAKCEVPRLNKLKIMQECLLCASFILIQSTYGHTVLCMVLSRKLLYCINTSL